MGGGVYEHVHPKHLGGGGIKQCMQVTYLAPNSLSLSLSLSLSPNRALLDYLACKGWTVVSVQKV